MLRITVSLVTRHGSERELGRLDIVRKRVHQSLADYEYTLHADDLPEPVVDALPRYPRLSATVWDLVARALVRGLFGAERLGKRPTAAVDRVPILEQDGVRYIRFVDIPEPARMLFERRLMGSTCPVIEGEGPDVAYASDWLDFVDGRR